MAAIVEGTSVIGNKEYDMVHLDLYGSACDSNAFISHPASTDNERKNRLIVPLKVFSTPDYAMTPNINPILKHKWLLKAFISERDFPISSKGSQTILLQPASNQYF